MQEGKCKALSRLQEKISVHKLDNWHRKAEDWPRLHQRLLCLAALRSLTPWTARTYCWFMTENAGLKPMSQETVNWMSVAKGSQNWAVFVMLCKANINKTRLLTGSLQLQISMLLISLIEETGFKSRKLTKMNLKTIESEKRSPSTIPENYGFLTDSQAAGRSQLHLYQSIHHRRSFPTGHWQKPPLVLLSYFLHPLVW